MFIKQPLASYHLNPYLITIKKRLKEEDDLQIYSGRYTDELSCLRLPTNIDIYCFGEGYDIYNLETHESADMLIKKFNLKKVNDHHILRESKTKDKIEIAIEFCQEALKK